MNALKSQGFDAPGTISRVLPKSVFQRTQNFESNSNYVSSDPFMQPSVDTPDQETSGVYLSPQIAAIAQNEVGDDEPEPDTQQVCARTFGGFLCRSEQEMWVDSGK